MAAGRRDGRVVGGAETAVVGRADGNAEGDEWRTSREGVGGRRDGGGIEGGNKLGVNSEGFAEGDGRSQTGASVGQRMKVGSQQVGQTGSGL